MLKKLSVTLEFGEKAYFVTPLNTAKDDLPYIYLDYFKVEDGRVEWMIKTSRGEMIVGGIKDEVPLPLYKGGWVTLSIPVTLHFHRKGLAPQFIFKVPGMVSIQKTPFQPKV